MLPESPQWLMKERRKQEARSVFKQNYNLSNQEATNELNRQISILQQTIEARGHLSCKQQWRTLRDKHSRSLCIGATLFLIYQFSGQYAVAYFAPQMFEKAGLGAEFHGLSHARTLLLYSLLVSIAELASTIIGLALVDRCGRRFLMLRFLPGTGGAMLLLALTYLLQFYGIQSAKWLSMVAIFLFMFSFGLGLLSTVFLINAQIFPLHLRASANSLAIIVNWTGSILISSSFLSISSSFIGKVAIILFYAVSQFLGLLFVYFYVPETKDRPLEELVQILQNPELPLSSRGKPSSQIDENDTDEKRPLI